MHDSINLLSRVNCPREAQSGSRYLVSVDLEHGLEPDQWPYDDEEYPVTCFLDAGPGFALEPAGDSTILVHRFGGSYGPARFWLTAREPGPAMIRYVLVNGAGLPIATETLPEIRIVEQARPATVTRVAAPETVPPMPRAQPHPRAEPAERVFRWLFLGDLHERRQGIQASSSRPEIIEDIRRQVAGQGIDAVIVAGDISMSAHPDQFAMAAVLLNEIRRVSAETEESWPPVIVVPGNHDADRAAGETLVAAADWERDANLRQKFWTDREHPARRAVEQAFGPYEGGRYQIGMPGAPVRGLLPGDCATSLKIRGLRVGIVGLNDSFLSPFIGSERRRRTDLHRSQLEAVCGTDLAGWAAAHDLRILVTHHSPEWLISPTRERFSIDIAPRWLFDIRLYASIHRGDPIIEMRDGVMGCNAAPKTEARRDMVNAYRIGEAKLSERGLAVRMQTRIERDSVWVPDVSERTDRDGARTETVPPRPDPPTQAAEPPITPSAPASSELARLRSTLSVALLARAGLLADATEAGSTIDPRAIDPQLWGALADAGVLENRGPDEWIFSGNLQVQLMQHLDGEGRLAGINVLWVDDQPNNNARYEEQLRDEGATVDLATSTEDALAALNRKRYDLIISDMARGADKDAGFGLMRALHERSVSTPVIIFALGFAADASRRRAAIRSGAFACTADGIELLQWINEATGRTTTTPLSAQQRELLEKLGSANLEDARQALESPEAAAEKVLASTTDLDSALQALLRVMQAVAGSGVNQVIRVEGNTLRVVAAVLDQDKGNSQYKTADWDGLIGRAARTGELTWVPDVSADSSYIAVEPATRSEFVIPLKATGLINRVGVINLEMDQVNALEEYERRWLQRFCAPFGDRLVLEEMQSPETKIMAAATAAEAAGSYDFAIVVGVDHAFPAPASEAGAQQFRGWLVDPAGGNLPADNVHVMLGTAGTKEAFMRAAESVLSAPRVRRLYLYLAGHIFAEDKTSSLFDMEYRLPQSRPAELSNLFGSFATRGSFNEIVVLLERSGTSPPGLGQDSNMHVLFAPFAARSRADLAFFFARGLSGEPSRRLTPLFIQGMQGAAARGEAGQVTSESMLRFLRSKHVTADIWLADNMPLRPARATVSIIFPPAMASGTVRIFAADEERLIAERQLEPGAATSHFYLPVGSYIARHVESGTSIQLKVERTPDYIEGILQPPERPPGLEISRQSFDMLVNSEAGSQHSYEARLMQPMIASPDGGIAIGIGYDLGTRSDAQIRADWHGRIDDKTLERLLAVQGQKGRIAQAALHTIRDIQIPYDAAVAVFERTLAEFAIVAPKTFPGIERLPPDARGALLSLIYNVGTSMAGPRRAAMRAIRKEVAEESPSLDRLADLVANLQLGASFRSVQQRRRLEAELIRHSKRAYDPSELLRLYPDTAIESRMR